MLLVDMFNEITNLMVNVRAAAPLTRELLLCFERQIVLTMAWTRLEFRSQLLRDGNRRIHARLLIHWRVKLFKLPIKFLRQHTQDNFIEYFVKCLSKKRHETKMLENKISWIIKIKLTSLVSLHMRYRHLHLTASGIAEAEGRRLVRMCECICMTKRISGRISSWSFLRASEQLRKLERAWQVQRWSVAFSWAQVTSWKWIYECKGGLISYHCREEILK